uniref:Uncharacterized protein n=1 Tax=viral metagenome TaxID=1070528 RepID=A0A6M3XD70_9ZZZZ
MKKNEKYIEKILTWAKKIGYQEEELVSRFNEYVKETSNEVIAYKRLRTELSDEHGSLLSSATPFYGYIIGDSGLYDRIDNMRQSATRAYDNLDTRQKAIDAGRVTDDGTVLDYRKKTRFGQDNLKFGLPIEGTELEKDLMAVISSDPNFEVIRVAKIVGSGDDSAILEGVQCFNWYAFRGTVGKSRADTNVINIYIGAGTKFRPFDTKLTPIELANKIESIEVSDSILGRMYKDKYDKKPNSQYIAVVEGMVAQTFLEPRDNRRSFTIIDEESGEAKNKLRCNISVNIPIVFKIYESLLVFGKLWKSARTNKYGIEVKGYLPLGLTEVE